MKLTVIIPAFNEENTIAQVIKNVQSINLGKIQKEIIIINDGSTDTTKAKLSKYKEKNLKIITNTTNRGKGFAIREALKIASGDIFIIQDADLEYDPSQFPLLLQPILLGQADVVYGSRFVTTHARRVIYFWHYLVNLLLTNLTNIVTNINLSDMETCYKAFTRQAIKSIDLQENRFGFEPEFTIKIAKHNLRIYEVGISYAGRSYKEGKKINWLDAISALWCILKYGVIYG